MRLRYVLAVFVIILLAGVAVLLLRTSSDPSALSDFMKNSDESKPSLALFLYNHGLIRNIAALNTALAIEDVHALLLKGMGLDTEAQNLANPFVRYVNIQEGSRNEQIADNVGTLMDWTPEQKALFVSEVTGDEGKLYPATYVLPDNLQVDGLRIRMLARFQVAVASSTNVISKRSINLETALTIASIIQREAAGKSDMNLISGIIWNRLFAGMPLDIDSTLQYAKGNTDNWWPLVTPADKSIDSPYNTYLNKGLPPTPISNPGLAAIQAAYNPSVTSCLYYFHDSKHQIHCSKTYAEHVAKIKEYL